MSRGGCGGDLYCNFRNLCLRPANDRYRPFRPIAHRPHPYRQCAHGAVQLAVRHEEQRPLRPALRRHRRRAVQAGICRRDPLRPALARHLPGRHRISVEAIRGLRRSRRQAEAGRAALRLLRDAGGTRPQAQDPPHARAAAGLRPRGAAAYPCADSRIRVRRAQAALALPAAELPQRSDRDRSAPRSTWTDLVRGEETVDLASLSDPILVREDGTYLYTLPSVTDDIDMGITHVIRGDDHVTNTGVQIALFKALGAEPPAFGHHNLLTTVTGEALSKRTGALSIAGLREAGIEPMTVASLAVLTGTSENVVAVPSMAELAKRFDLGAHLEVGRQVRSGRSQRAEPRSAAPDAVQRGARPAGGVRHHRATRPSRSGSRCAAISTSLPTPPIGGASCSRGRTSRPNSPRRTRNMSARRSTCCRRSLGTGTPGRPGPTR